MNIEIVCVGKIKEKYLEDAIKEYSKRLSRYVKLKITEQKDEKTIDGQSAALDLKVKETEGARIISALKDDAVKIVLDLNGRELSSPEFATRIQDYMVSGKGTIQFIIGGSLGLSSEVIKRADFLLKFGEMTYPHQLMRVMLLEQIYRAFRIMNNEPYHK